MTLLDLSSEQESIQEFERTDEFPEPIESEIDRKTDEKALKDYSTQVSETVVETEYMLFSDVLKLKLFYIQRLKAEGKLYP